MILTKSPIFLQDSAGPTPWSALVLRFFRRSSSPRNPHFLALLVAKAGCLSLILCAASCAPPSVTPGQASGNYVLKSTGPAVRQSAVVVYKEVTIDGKPLRKGAQRAQELDKGVADFTAMLGKSGLFQSVRQGQASGVQGVVIEVSYAERENSHGAGNFTKGFLSGALTLGLAPVRLDYSYSSSMTIRVLSRGNCILTNTSEKSASGQGSYAGGSTSPDEVQMAGRMTRRSVTDENNKAAVYFLISNKNKLN
jgi:hypothetical protein